MFSHVINIVVPHKLDIERAQAAVLAMLANYKNTDPQVTWSDIEISNVSHAADVHVVAHGVKVTAHIVVAADRVTFYTEPIEGMVPAAVAEMWVEPKLRTMFTDALK